jgi:cellulose synthase/poly-beta-1,6-N-acetylglucosamine synthase-like glycosyltransferase
MQQANGTQRPAVTVVILTDFEVGTEKAWEDLRATLRGVAAQDFSGSAEFIFLEDERLKDQIPEDLRDIVPQLQIALTGERLQYDMKSEAARLGTADVVVLLDGDCIPVVGWLRALVETMRAHPKAGVVSGRTTYEGKTFLERACGVLGRAYVDRRGTQRTEHISNNNAAFRRDVLLTHPLPSQAGPFSSKLHAEAIRRDGWDLLVAPRAAATHAFEGWGMERDIRRNMGYGFIKVRQIDPRLPFGQIAQLGYASLPFYFVARIVESWWRTLQFYRNYGLQWYEVPGVLGLAVGVHVMEIPGMITAVQGRTIAETAYR